METLHNERPQDTFRVGARLWDPQDKCPTDTSHRIVFGTDFTKFGRHQIRVCLDCPEVYENGERRSDLELHPARAPLGVVAQPAPVAIGEKADPLPPVPAPPMDA